MAPTRWLDDEDQQTWRLYLAATHLLSERLGRELNRDAGLSHADYRLLVLLSEAQDRRLRMSELAELFQFSRSRISHAVSRLEDLGWVRREMCETDRRGSLAVLTDEGFAVLRRAAPGHVEGVRRHLFEPLSREQVGQLHDICQVLVDHLSGLEDAPACPDAPAETVVIAAGAAS